MRVCFHTLTVLSNLMRVSFMPLRVLANLIKVSFDTRMSYLLCVLSASEVMVLANNYNECVFCQ